MPPPQAMRALWRVRAVLAAIVAVVARYLAGLNLVIADRSVGPRGAGAGAATGGVSALNRAASLRSREGYEAEYCVYSVGWKRSRQEDRSKNSICAGRPHVRAE